MRDPEVRICKLCKRKFLTRDKHMFFCNLACRVRYSEAAERYRANVKRLKSIALKRLVVLARKSFSKAKNYLWE